MRCLVEPHRSRPWGRLAVFAAIAATVAGCSSDADRFENPFASRSAPPASEVTGSVQHQQRTPSVQSTPLPPPSAAAPATRPVSGGISGGSRGMGSFQPGTVQPEITGSVPPKPAPQQVAAPARPAWNWEGGTPITAAPGDTAEKLSHRYGVPAAAIIQANNLPNGNAIRPGQKLVIPRYEATGSVGAQRTVQPKQQVTAGGASHVHIIAPGETLMKLSRQYNKPLGEIARANNIPSHTMVKVGDRITIPGVRPAHQAMAQRQQAAPQPPKPVAAAAQPKQQPPKVAAVQTTAPTTTARLATPVDPEPAPPARPKVEAKPETSTTSSAPSTFRWPVRGRVILGFGPKTGGQQNDGINVAVPEGTPIRAAEDGVVAYAGNELKTFGNLVLVRHSNGFVTAYAHASEILVKRDDQVKRGQVIAKAGQTGNVATSQLHFEIRKGSTPIDPMPMLEKGGNG